MSIHSSFDEADVYIFLSLFFFLKNTDFLSQYGTFGAYVFNKLKLVQEMVYGISSVIYDSGFSVPEKGSFSEGEGKVVTKCVFWVPRNTSPHRRNDCVTHGGNGGGGRGSGVG